MTEDADALDYLWQAPALTEHALLLAAATRDNSSAGVAMRGRLARAVTDAGERDVHPVTYEDDHSFST